MSQKAGARLRTSGGSSSWFPILYSPEMLLKRRESSHISKIDMDYIGFPNFGPDLGLITDLGLIRDSNPVAHVEDSLAAELVIYDLLRRQRGGSAGHQGGALAFWGTYESTP